MTMAIAVTLPDGVLLVADGKITKPLIQEVHCSDEDKIEHISPTVSAIPLGVTHATTAALTHLRDRATGAPSTSPEDFLAGMASTVASAWQNFILMLAPGVDKNHHAMRAALVAGGIIAGVPFIAGFLCGSHGQESSVLQKGPALNFIVLGGEQQGAQEMFQKAAEIALKSHVWVPHEGPVNNLVKCLLDAAVATIRTVEKVDIGIGGTIRFLVIRDKHQPLKATIET